MLSVDVSNVMWTLRCSVMGPEENEERFEVMELIAHLMLVSISKKKEDIDIEDDEDQSEEDKDNNEIEIETLLENIDDNDNSTTDIVLHFDFRLFLLFRLYAFD
jgi:hypothetical protein